MYIDTINCIMQTRNTKFTASVKNKRNGVYATLSIPGEEKIAAWCILSWSMAWQQQYMPPPCRGICHSRDSYQAHLIAHGTKLWSPVERSGAAGTFWPIKHVLQAGISQFDAPPWHGNNKFIALAYNHSLWSVFISYDILRTWARAHYIDRKQSSFPMVCTHHAISRKRWSPWS